MSARLGEDQTRSGKKSEAARAMGIQLSYLSRVLSQKAHLSNDQAFLFGRWAALSETDLKIFLNLHEEAKAAHHEYRRLLQDARAELVAQKNRIKGRIGGSRKLTSEERGIYYSSWIYAAVHQAVSIPAFQRLESLQKKFPEAQEKMPDIVSFLLRHGLVEEKSGNLIPGKTNIHLPDRSKHLEAHHRNWRLKGLQAIERSPAPNDLHYSVTFSISKNDLEKTKAVILDAIAKTIQIVRPSSEETLAAMTIDFFEL